MTRRLHRLNRRLRTFDRRRPLVWDAVFTGFSLTVALNDFLGGGWRNITENPQAPNWLLIALSLGFTVPLMWRRTHPVAVLLTMLPLAVVNSWTGTDLQAGLIILVVAFNIAVHTRLRTLLCCCALTMAPIVVDALRHPAEQGADQTIVPQATRLAMMAIIGISYRTRQEYLASLVERARQLEVERDQQARLATAAERARIAREMHDIIGHNLSVITSLADGGSYAAAKNPERAVQALTAIGATSRQALGELRRLLDVLRTESPDAGTSDAGPHPLETAPQPSLADLDHLLDGVRSAGLPVRSTVQGSAATLPPGRQLTVYRVIQEALTNTLKHGGPEAESTVRVSYGDGGAVTVTVTDTGVGAGAHDNGSRGSGLTRMRERTALYGGTLESGPLPEQGWHVRLHLPEETAQSPPCLSSTTSRSSASASACSWRARTT
ncbi:histidine kinase [Streptomyces sp. LRE541]|uniref:sensor histidine kinase n=1 Tax=Streptomyces sp. LRE541 TaxID=2931983 RepID=UPI00200CB998|nr:histidine kinase [Streptomyces sp. LRE541]UPZ34243.1 histidine kinase [Streptomyces sp. LRE541]